MPETEFIKIADNFILEAMSHSGLAANNSINIKYFYIAYLHSIFTPNIKELLDDLLNKYMIEVHNNYRKNKTWKSYDW